MTPQALLLLLLAAAVAVAVAAASADPANGAANDLLPKYGLPRGLIPDSVSSYTFDEATGDFEIHLAGTCYVRFGDHLVYYEKALRGCLSKGRITGLSGIQAKKLFLWVSVSGIVAHPEEGTLEFQVGFVSEELSASLFDRVPVCGASAGAQLRGVAGVIQELGLLPVAEDGCDWG
ncbi:unnamed protein product [Triticum turgidum subsp. durum]|uniref:Uncharacterized protein n=1 Tax=Triticum turgidum subsp. durum TaxID=4567 RepID=A0A9R0W777_TRITD|nr:unnamed protein product [Triticum turgidum subsp. durum]